MIVARGERENRRRITRAAEKRRHYGVLVVVVVVVVHYIPEVNSVPAEDGRVIFNAVIQ